MSESVQIEKREINHKCTSCGNNDKIDVEIQKPKEKVILSEQQTTQIKDKLPEIKEVEKIVEKIVEKVRVPSHIPKIKCKDCKDTHENPNYQKRPKFKCNNCNSLNPDAECLTCNKGEEFEEMTDEDLDELGIPQPKEREHEHESEE